MHALDGIRVLELAQMWAVPGAGMYLGDQGAEVIKVEPPWGDECRRVVTSSPIKTGDREVTRHFLPLNRNKKSIAIDITRKEGIEIVYRLAETADVLLHNYRPGACKRLGIDFETFRQINPRLIYLDFSPYGKKGPYVNKPGYDRVIQAVSGVHGRRALSDGTPMAAGVWIADCSAPMLIAYGVALALLMREKTGKGQKVDTSLLSSAIAMQSVELVKAETEKEDRFQSFADQAMFAPYVCMDDKWLILVVVNNKEWAALNRALDLTHLTDDPRYATALKRSENSHELFQVLSGVFSTKSRDEWLDILEAADVPSAPILKPEEIFNHPQMLENEIIIDVDDPRVGRMKMMGIPVKLSDAPGDIRMLAPELGEHTEEVLLGLGYQSEVIEALRQKKIIV
ncbi:CaiB/BaiF CoA transferase family protein [Thermodesulfobacteriota bacterium]